MNQNALKFAFASLTFGVAVLGCPPVFAASGEVSESASNQIQLGETRDRVIQALGTPRSAPKWLNGETSLVYTIIGGESDNEALYVDIDANGMVKNVTVLDNSDDSGN